VHINFLFRSFLGVGEVFSNSSQVEHQYIVLVSKSSAYRISKPVKCLVLWRFRHQIRRLRLRDFTLISNRGVLDITQCTSLSGLTGNCNTSTLAVSDLGFSNVQGTVVAGVAQLGTFDCSRAASCYNITISDVNVEVFGNGSQVREYSCTAIERLVDLAAS
jgi:hypothetical protein